VPEGAEVNPKSSVGKTGAPPRLEFDISRLELDGVTTMASRSFILFIRQLHAKYSLYSIISVGQALHNSELAQGIPVLKPLLVRSR
jgi:hypothetical protein